MLFLYFFKKLAAKKLAENAQKKLAVVNRPITVWRYDAALIQCAVTFLGKCTSVYVIGYSVGFQRGLLHMA